MAATNRWVSGRGGMSLLLILVALLILVGLYLSSNRGLASGAPEAELSRRCTSAKTEAACHSLRLYRQTTYDAGACAWQEKACRFTPGDGG